MVNELLFFLQNILISSIALACIRFSASAATAFIAITTILANLLVSKQINLIGFTVTPTDSFMIGSILGLNLMQEYYGKKSAFEALWIGFGASVCLLIFAFIHLQFIPSSFDIMHPHYYAIFHNTPRIIIASLLAYGISQNIELALYGFLKKKFHSNHLLLRSNSSMIIAQLADTILFSFVGLYGLVEHIEHIIIISFLMKLIAIGLTSPFVLYSKLIMKSRNSNAEI